MKQNRIFRLICALALTMGLLIPSAAAAGGPRLTVTSQTTAASQTVGLTGLPTDSQSLQVTLTLSTGTACQFQADSALAQRSGVYVTYQQNGSGVTIYVTAKTGTLSDSGRLTLGTLTASDGSTDLSVEKISGLKLLSEAGGETIYPTVSVDPGAGSGSTGDQPTRPGISFADVVQGSWYYDAVQYAYEHGLMSGTGEGTFSPNLPTSRGMIVTILYRLAGSPEAAAPSFTDVAAGQWYADGVAWASAHGVVSGYPDGSFRPDDTITREQMAAILYQYARLQGKLDSGRADLSSFADVNALSAYAKEPMSWAVARGLFSGVTPDTLAPGGSTTRAQAAVILTAFSKSLG